MPSCCCVVGLLLSHPPRAIAIVFGPLTGTERKKAEERAARPAVPIGRPTLEVTGRLRERCWRNLLDWTIHDRIEFERILLASHLHVEEINAILVKYGRLFDSAGEPYTVFAETIKMLSSMKPVLRRQLQGAWDLAFSWVQAEPSSRFASHDYSCTHVGLGRCGRMFSSQMESFALGWRTSSSKKA